MSEKGMHILHKKKLFPDLKQIDLDTLFSFKPIIMFKTSCTLIGKEFNCVYANKNTRQLTKRESLQY
jgi:hypothetical protein